MSVTIELNKMLCKDLLNVGSQKSKAMNQNTLSSQLTNLNRPISNTNKECQFHNILRSIYPMIPDMFQINMATRH